MRLILFNFLSLDGFFEGPNQELDWHQVDDEFRAFAIAQLHKADALVFGRKTYEHMASYWPTPGAIARDPAIAGPMNSLGKVVFSRTLKQVDWNNSILAKSVVTREITDLKKKPGKDILIFGSAELVSSLMKDHLIDEYRIMINPVLLGSGTPHFKVGEKYSLKLLRTVTFKSGNVLLFYEESR
jgi:dihydrofolate reductase